MSIGAGIAVAGIWLSVAAVAFSEVGLLVLPLACLAGIATLTVSSLGTGDDDPKTSAPRDCSQGAPDGPQ